ncbi:hypothetical protein ACN9JG_15070 [Cereibacter azotoformans]|uniref:Flagellar protein FlgN n=1 Tax=Cereibacter sphaeroides (strain ATCC 17025 / ATH 2.4.3) TaxID=349102 RepID=A4WVS2_CERS5
MRSEPTQLLLEHVLEDMRQKVIAGDLAGLADLESGLADAMERQPPATADQAQRVRALASRNLGCLEAASRGVRAARRRLTEIRQAASGVVVVYDDQGRRTERPPEPPPRQRL